MSETKIFRKKDLDLEPVNGWWPGTESNRRHKPFQGSALPTELPGLIKT